MKKLFVVIALILVIALPLVAAKPVHANGFGVGAYLGYPIGLNSATGWITLGFWKPYQPLLASAYLD